ISSTSSQDRILELFNLGVADVLVKPIEEQAAKTLFLNAHRYSKHKSAVTIPRYATQKNSLTLPSHTRLRNVFLKDQWLSDILVSHYCPTPTKISLQDFPSMSSNGAQERVEELKIRLLSWDFHPHDLCEDDLMRCVVIVIQEVMKLEGLGDLNIPEHLLHRFVVGLRDSYHRSNPYHNFAHAVDVLQATFYFLCRMGKLPLTGSGYPPLPNVNGHTGAETQVLANIPTDLTSAVDADARSRLRVQDFLRPEDIFALIVASIGHDVGHPGVNNMFLINAHTPLAQIYNDRSVLESFHSMALFQVMKKHGFECFDVDSQNRKFLEFRKMVVSTILATDMGLHFDYVGKIKEQTERIRLRGLPGGDAPKHNQASIDEQERLVLCGTLIKCADISNASRPFHVAERWCTVLLQEMCNQADIEKEMAVCSGLQPVPAGSTKSLANDRGMQIDSQLGFIHGFAMPLFGSVRDMIPEMGYCVDFLQINHQIWQDRKTDYLKNGGGSIFVPINATKACSEDEDLAEKVVPAPKMATNHGRAKTPTGKVTAQSIPSNRDGIRTGSRKGQHATESDGGQQSRGSDLVSIKPRAGNAKRSRSAAAAESSEAPASLSAIPRPRMRTKAAASDNNAQDARQNGLQRGGAVEQGSRSRLSSPREPNSRVRTVTSATTLSIPVSSGSVGPKSGYTSVKARSRPVTPTSRQQQQQQQQQPNAPVPLKQSSRGHRSPGRRSQHVKEKTNGLLNGESGPHQDQPESLVLRSPLSVSTPSLSMVATETSPSISSAEI
ncbi:3',5'-cyclic-nucleotide phosphodiesterase, partial [Dissophora ornata]